MGNLELENKKCTPCEGGTKPLIREEIEPCLNQLKGWIVVEEHHLMKEYKFKDFKEALEFVNKIGEVAETEGHHPDIHLSWGKVEVIIWTHSIGGLSINDFIIAAKIDKLRS